jgi:hypothetical protein
MAIPVIKMGSGSGSTGKSTDTKAKAKVKSKPKLVTKKAADKPKAKVKAKTKAKKAAKSAKPVKRTPDQVPAALAPPDMRDTRPVQTKPTATKPGPVPVPIREVTYEEVTAQPSPVRDMSAPISPEKLTPPPNPQDTTLVQGLHCTWIGNLGHAPSNEENLPVCPHCHQHLLDVAGGRETLEMGLEAYELGAYSSVNPPPRPHIGYRGFMHWVMEQSKYRCWPGPLEAAEAYREETGITVNPL